MTRHREYWNPIMETMDVEKLREIQWKRFKKIFTHAWNHSAFYRELYDKAGVTPEDIKSLDDVKKIPILRKDMWREVIERENDPFARNLTIPLHDVEMIHQSSGTTGIPTFTALTRGEYEALSEFFARSMWCMGLRPGDRYMGPGLIIHPVIAYLGVGGQRIGAKMFQDIPHPATAQAWFNYVKYTKMRGMLAPPSDGIPAMAEEARKQGLSVEEVFSGITSSFTYGEPITTHVKDKGKKILSLPANIHDGHALSELFVVDTDCYLREGNHMWMDLCYLETVDPDTDELLKPGEMGEIVFTNLIMESTPVVRFGTEDMGIILEEKCGCGRTHPRVKWFGRTNWRVNVKGKPVMPLPIQEIFERFPETEDAFFTIVKEGKEMERLYIRGAYKEEITRDPLELKNRVQAEIKKELGIDSEIEWVGLDQIPFRFHKIVRVTEA